MSNECAAFSCSFCLFVCLFVSIARSHMSPYISSFWGACEANVGENVIGKSVKRIMHRLHPTAKRKVQNWTYFFCFYLVVWPLSSSLCIDKLAVKIREIDIHRLLWTNLTEKTVYAMKCKWELWKNKRLTLERAESMRSEKGEKKEGTENRKTKKKSSSAIFPKWKVLFSFSIINKRQDCSVRVHSFKSTTKNCRQEEK